MKSSSILHPLSAILCLVLLLSADPASAAARRRRPAPFHLQPALVLTATNSESQCLQILQSNASLTEKDAACARLKVVGTDRAVPALAALLTDEQLSHSARYVLEAMSSPAAGRALLEALDHTTGALKVGIIDSLAVRREADAVPALAKALKDPDASVATAAAAALGEIATPKALRALKAASKRVTGPLHDTVVDALLRCANRLLAAGKPSKARPLFQQVHSGEKRDFVRMAAFRGLILASGKYGLALATQAITGPAGPDRTAALQLVHDLSVSGATAAFAQLLTQVAVPIQVSLIEGLSQRDDPGSVPAIAALLARTPGAPAPSPASVELLKLEPSNLKSPICLPVLSALGILGDASVVPLLAQAAASATGAEQAAARDALARLHRGQVAQALLSQLSAAQPAVQAEAARALGARSDSVAIPQLLALARQGSPEAASSATLALAQLVDQEQLADLVQLVLDAKTETARAEAAEALNSACQHIQARRGRLEAAPLLKGLAAGSPEARVALLPVCAAFNQPQVRDALRAAIADANPVVRAAAIRAVSDTTDPELLPDLLKLACSAPEENLRTLAVGGCVRLATQEESVKLPDSRRVETFKAILAASPTTAQKRLVLAGLARVHSLEAFRLVEPMLTDSPVQNEAARAIISIAPALPDSAAIAALKQVLAVVPEGPAHQDAAAVLKRREAECGFITLWQVAGPYQQAGKDYSALFDIPFPPETAKAQSVRWQTLPAGTDAKHPWLMDLLKAFGGQERVAYARTWIHSDRRQPARLELGSDDGIKAWLNQSLVRADNTSRALRAGSDRAEVTLNAGWNLLLLKVTQHNLGWAFCARLLRPDGLPIPGLQCDADAPAHSSAKYAPPRAPRVTHHEAPDPTFKRIQLTDKFWAEGAALADFNRDGRVDVVSGPFWYQGPDFKKRHEIWPATASFKRKLPDGAEQTVPGFEGALGLKNAYSECFLTFTWDFNHDGWPDVLVIGFPGKAAYWYENPRGAAGDWPRHEVFGEVGNESPGFADITGDGKPEILCCARGCLGYLQADWNNPTATWSYHPISRNTPKGAYQKFTHGIGCGDINGDGRADIIEKDGWWEQPASCQGDPVWLKHPFHFADAAAQILVYDVNGDGLNDVITCLNAHGYGLAWYEQVRSNGSVSFRRHLILNADATPNRYGVCFTQPHALALADMNGDGLMDVVTGKRFWAHGKNGGDPESDGYPAVLYWFQLSRSANGQVEFIPHLVDDNSGVGTEVTAGLIANPKLPGIVVGNKKGLFVFQRQSNQDKPTR